MLFHPVLGERATWAVGGFTSIADFEDRHESGTSDLTVTGRLTGLPLYENEGHRLVHLGASYSLRDPEDDTIRYRTRPETRSVDFFVDTGEFTADSNTLVGLELATVFGRSWGQGEYIRSYVDESSLGDPEFDGYYVQIGHFLTPDRKPYDRQTGTIGHMMPANPFTERVIRAVDNLHPFDQRAGALELVGRYSTVDLDDGPIQGGQLTDVSLGLNWYLDTYRRINLNYIHSHIEDGGRANILILRLQFAF